MSNCSIPGDIPIEIKAAITVPAIVANPLVITVSKDQA